MLLRHLYQYRRYIFNNAWNELRFRYAGTTLGIFWNLVHPLCEITVYTLVFSVLLLRGTGERSYALYLTSGLLPWRTLTDGLMRGGDAFKQNAHFLKRLALPPEVFVAKVAVTSLFLLAIYLIFLIPLSALFGGRPALGVLLLPLIAVMFQNFGFGIELLLANLQVLFPDLRQMLQFLLPLWSWTMPIFYPDEAIPEAMRPWLYLNPPYSFVESIRYLILENRFPSLFVWGAMFGWMFLFLGLGMMVHQKLQDEMRDSL